MPASSWPSNSAESSAAANRRAASRSGSRSTLAAPRSIRSSSRAVELELDAQLDQRPHDAPPERRACASRLASGSTRPRSIAEWSQPSGPSKSTSRRAARWRLQDVARLLLDALPHAAAHRRELSIQADHLASAPSPRRLPIRSVPPSSPSGSVARLGVAPRLRPALDRAGPEQELAQELVELRVVAADPLEHHARVLLLLVAIVREHRGELGVVAGVDALRVPVHRVELFDQRAQRAVHLARLGAQRLGGFVELRCCHPEESKQSPCRRAGVPRLASASPADAEWLAL